MGKEKKQARSEMASARPAGSARRTRGLGVLLVIAIGFAAAGVGWRVWRGSRPPTTAGAVNGSNQIQIASAPAGTGMPLPSAEVAQALMVTVELDLAGKAPSIREALGDVERRYEPEDGVGRTFAILDAYGEPTPAGKLHMSMHLSLEKPGVGALVYRRTGEVLWKSRIVPGKSAPAGDKSLTVLMDDGHGKSLQLDGSRGVGQVLDIPFRDSNTVVRQAWPDGEEREFTFIYSACGCPVKAKVRRTGETTTRTSELPVMFPDDPAALSVIHRLMGWP